MNESTEMTIAILLGIVFGGLGGMLAELLSFRILQKLKQSRLQLKTDKGPTMVHNNYKAGDLVKILSMDKILERDSDYTVGEVCEVLSTDDDEVKVYTADKSDYWYFTPYQLELV